MGDYYKNGCKQNCVWLCLWFFELRDPNLVYLTAKWLGKEFSLAPNRYICNAVLNIVVSTVHFACYAPLLLNNVLLFLNYYCISKKYLRKISSHNISSTGSEFLHSSIRPNERLLAKILSDCFKAVNALLWLYGCWKWIVLQIFW